MEAPTWDSARTSMQRTTYILDSKRENNFSSAQEINMIQFKSMDFWNVRDFEIKLSFGTYSFQVLKYLSSSLFQWKRNINVYIAEL